MNNHPNWTGKAPRTDERPGLFIDPYKDEPPHWAIQVLFLIIWAVALWAACYL